MELELQKYECGSEDYLIYDCNRNRYEFGAREARVMCSLNIGISVRRVLVGHHLADHRYDFSYL